MEFGLASYTATDHDGSIMTMVLMNHHSIFIRYSSHKQSYY